MAKVWSAMERAAATMPKWPAYVMLAAAAACAYPAVTAPPSPAPAATYRALGQEPGWSLTIGGGSIVYLGDYGETQITRAAPEPRTTFNGHRYETPGLIVDITHTRCHDAMSGHAYADTVMVIAGDRTVRGCGGERLPQHDR